MLFLFLDYFLISALISQFFIVTAELTIPTGTPTNEENAETETQPLTGKLKTRKCSKQFKSLRTFYAFLSLNRYVLFLASSIFFNLKSGLTFSFAIFVFKVHIYSLVIPFIVIQTN